MLVPGEEGQRDGGTEGGPTLSPMLWRRRGSQLALHEAAPSPQLGGTWHARLVSWVTESLAIRFSVLSVRVHSDTELAAAGCRGAECC